MTKLKILLTNDDGINTYSTLDLAEILREKGHEVITVIPKENMSGVSGAMSITKELEVDIIEKGTITVTGTPCDCINMVVSGNFIENNFDIVISGINKGENAGLTVYDSGTVAAARRAKAYGYPSIAVSYADYLTNKTDMEKCNRYFVELLEDNNYFIDQGDEFININIPHIELVEGRCFSNVKHRSTYVGKGIYRQVFDELSENVYVYNNQDALDKGTFEDGCDHDTLNKGEVSISLVVM